MLGIIMNVTDLWPSYRAPKKHGSKPVSQVILSHKADGCLASDNKHRGITLFILPGNVFAHQVLMSHHGQLLKLQKREQSGFTPGMSKIDRIAGPPT